MSQAEARRSGTIVVIAFAFGICFLATRADFVGFVTLGVIFFAGMPLCVVLIYRNVDRRGAAVRRHFLTERLHPPGTERHIE